MNIEYGEEQKKTSLQTHEEEGVAGHLERVRDHVARRPFKLPLRANPRGHLPKKRGRAVNKKGAKTKKETKKRETNKFLTFPTRRRTRPCPRNRTCCQTCTRTRPNPRPSLPSNLPSPSNLQSRRSRRRTRSRRTRRRTAGRRRRREGLGGARGRSGGRAG